MLEKLVVNFCAVLIDLLNRIDTVGVLMDMSCGVL
jgi:hypothetical protein